jgi:hypothetical protein
MKKATLTEDKAEKTPTGGVLVGKREGQTIIHNKGTLSGYLVGRTHAKGGIKAINKSTGQPLEMQGGEVVITAPAVSDNTKNEFNGKMMTNREILSQINVKGGGVAFAKDGMEIPKSVKHTGASYNYGGKTMTDHEIIKHITGGHLSKGMTLTQIAKMHKVSLKELQKQVDMGMKAESEHTSSKREQMKIVKDHLYENPKYYSLLKKAGLNHGGRVHRGSLVRDAKSGNTPARDLNNYNDVLDLDADGMVGAETSLYATGGMFNTEPFLNYYFDEIAEFLKYQNNITLNKDFAFKYKGELFRVEPIVLSEKNIKEAYFSIIDSDDEEVGDIVFNPNNNKKFEANSDFFDWNNIKFYDGGDVKPYDANMEGDSANMMFVTGGGVKELVEYITIASYSDNPYQDDDKIKFYNFIDFKNYIRDVYANDGATNKRQIYLCINNDTSTSKLKIYVSQGKNTNLNFNPFTGTFKDLEKNLKKYSIGNFDLFDWNRWGGIKSSTSTPSQTSVPNTKVLTKKDLQDCKIWIGDDLDLRDKVVTKLIELGIPEDSKYKNSAINNLNILTFSKDFIILDTSKAFFEEQEKKEIFPANLGIDVNNLGSSTPASTTTSGNTKFFQFTGETLTEIPDSIPNFSGIIKDLPEKIKQLALQMQVDAGNTPNEDLKVKDSPFFGNFSWEKTGEGNDFWDSINVGNFVDFKKIYGDYGEGLTGINVSATPTSTSGKFTADEIDLFNQIDIIVNTNNIKTVYTIDWMWETNAKDFYVQSKLTGEVFSLRFLSDTLGTQNEDINPDKTIALLEDYKEWKATQPTTATPTSTIQPIEVTKLTLEDLTNSKIYLGNDPALCEKIQTVAFLLGLRWVDGDGRVSELDAECLFFDDSTINRMEFGDATKFAKSKFKQIYVVDSKTTAKTTSKPFDLTKTKIWIDNLALSEKVQKKAFELGWEWYGEDLKNVQDKGIPVALFFEDTKRIEWTDNKDYFDNKTNDFKEIFESDIFGNSTSTASQTSTQNAPVEDEDWVKKFTADLDKLATYLPNDISFAPQLSKEKKDLENLKKLLPSFQQKKYAIERAKILKEIKRLHNKLTYEGFIQGNEEGSTGADLFTPQGLLDYYYTQATQNPTADLDPSCELPTPNGEKSKLPLSAYLNVRTPQFKNWFGDWEKAYETGNYVNCSKMIDPDTKEPKIYFHGVRKYVPNFGQFSNMGQGVVRPYGAFEPTFPASYFAGEEDYAKFYGGIAENLPTPSADYKPFIYKVFLSVKNPISLLPLDFMLSYKDFLDYIYVGYGVKVIPNQQLLTLLENDMNKKNPMWIYIRRDIGVIELLKDYGYDAIFQMGDIPVFLPNGEVEPDRTKHLQEVEYLTFYPNQVKSATVKKSFYFDFFNDIRFKNGGYVRI